MRLKSTDEPVESGIARAEIETHLERVLASREFSASPRCREFLTFVVRRALDGHPQSINERMLATAVFGRIHHFDPSEESIVRVKAGEVRRRLANFYTGEGVNTLIRIELPVGGYAPRFKVVEAQPEPEAADDSPAPRRRLTATAVISLSAAAIVVLLGVLAVRPAASPVDRFWGPVLQGNKPVMLCIPSRLTLRLPGEDRTLADDAASAVAAGVDRGNLAALKRLTMVGLGDAHGLSSLSALCGRMGKPFSVKVSNDVTFADFRNQPAVVLGGRWTGDVSKELRFALNHESARGTIIDLQDRSRVWRQNGLSAGEGPGEDYGLVVRLLEWKNGRPLVMLAGMTTFGTQSAAEFVTDPAALQELDRNAPPGWERKNLELVVETRVIGKTPSRPRVVASHYW